MTWSKYTFNPVDERKIMRASTLLGMLSEEEAYEVLREDMSDEDAYLAIKAAKVKDKRSNNPSNNVNQLSVAIDRVMTEYPRRQRRNRLHKIHDEMIKAGIPSGHWLWEQLSEAEYQTTIGAFP